MPPFGFGLSMPNLRKTGGGAAPVVPMTIRGNPPTVAQTASGFIDGGTLFFNAASIPGDVIIIAYTDDSGTAPSWGASTGYGSPVQVAHVGVWYIFQAKATGTSANATYSPTFGSAVAAYSFSAGWQVRGANSTTPFESAAVCSISIGVGNLGSFNVTTASNNDCVLGVAYPTPLPTELTIEAITGFSVLTSGWNALGPTSDDGENPIFYTVNNSNVAVLGTVAVATETVVTSSPAAANIVTINLKK